MNRSLADMFLVWVKHAILYGWVAFLAYMFYVLVTQRLAS